MRGTGDRYHYWPGNETKGSPSLVPMQFSQEGLGTRPREALSVMRSKMKSKLIAGAFAVSVAVSFSLVYFSARQPAAGAGRRTKVLIPVDSLTLSQGRGRGMRPKGAETLPISDRIVLRDIRDVGQLGGKQWADKRRWHKDADALWKHPKEIKNGLDLDLRVDRDDMKWNHIKAMADSELLKKARPAFQLTEGWRERARANGWKVLGESKSRTAPSWSRKSRDNAVTAELPPETYDPIPAESDWRAGRCRDPMCSEFLSINDRAYFRKCRNVSQSPSAVDAKPQCHFMDGRNRDPVGLVSYPGSGNTWVRGLLEKATGVCTGAIYCDRALRYQGFVGENIVSGSVLVVKSHVHTYQWKGEVLEYLHQGVQSVPALFESAIFLVRNPFDVLVSERKRLMALIELGNTTWPPPPGKLDDSHTKSVNQSYFGSNREWSKFIHTHCNSWVAQIQKWVLHPVSRTKKVMVVRYEDLRTDKLAEVARMLDFLKFPYTEESLGAQLQEDFAVFRRKQDTFDHYTPEQREYVNGILREADRTLQQSNMDDLFHLQDYISS